MIKFVNAVVQSRSDRPCSKPEGREYLMMDGHNSRKHHHVIIDEEGRVYYNQAIQYDEIVRGGKVISEACYQDFYDWQEVGCNEWHGYREYLDAAMIEHNKPQAQEAPQEAPEAPQRDDLISAGDTFQYWNNQAYRDATVLGTIGSEAIIEVEMPSGRSFLHVVKRIPYQATYKPVSWQTDIWIRTISWNKIPKKWQRAAGI